MPIRKKFFKLLRTISGKAPSAETVKGRANVETPQTLHSEPPKNIEPPPPKSVTPAEQLPATNTSTVDADTDLVLYGRPSCPYCARVDRVIEELDIEDKITRRLTSSGTEWRSDLRDRTGSTQVPCLFIDGEVMFESADIISWMRSHFV